jgi:hypothetical protein
MKWVETNFEGDPMQAIRIVMQSHSTGQLVLNVSQGTVRTVKWREKVSEATQDERKLDSVTAP